MNLIDLVVTEVLSEPVHHKFSLGECWTVEVMSNGYGVVKKSTVYCRSEHEARQVKVGYKYQA